MGSRVECLGFRGSGFWFSYLLVDKFQVLPTELLLKLRVLVAGGLLLSERCSGGFPQTGLLLVVRERVGLGFRV